MSISIADLLVQLQNALDANYNVTDMPAILQIITVLEGLHITKEQLETTRLGKHINQLRRKTVNETLARRLKNLLRKWREMILPETASTPSANPPIAIPAKANGAKASIKDQCIEAKLGSPLLTINTSKVSPLNDGSARMFSDKTKSNQMSFVHSNNHPDTFGKYTKFDNEFDVRTNPQSIVSAPNSACQSYQTYHQPELSPSITSIKNDDDETTMHHYDMQQHMQTRYIMSSQNSRNNIFPNNSNSSSKVCASADCIPTTALTSVTTTPPATNIACVMGNGTIDSKKKSKKHKKEKKKKKSSKNSLEVKTLLELADNTSSNSMSQYSSTSKAMTSSIIASDNNVSNEPSEHNFIGKFGKGSDAVINIDSSSCSNSPKYGGFPDITNIADRHVFPAAIPKTALMTSFQSNTKSGAPRQPTEFEFSPGCTNPIRNESDSALQNTTVPTEPKRRGRKRGSKGVDGRIADNNALSSQSNSVLHYDDSGSLLSLKTKIESIRGSKKVKTTKELLADLQNRKSAIGFESCSSNYGSKTSSPTLSVGYTSQNLSGKSQHCLPVPSPSTFSENSEQSHTNSTTGLRSTTATPATVSPDILSTTTIENISSVYNFKPGSDLQSQSIPSNAEFDFGKLTALESDRNGIEEEIFTLKSQLKPIEEDMLQKWHDEEVESIIKCTCTVKEVECDVPVIEENIVTESIKFDSETVLLKNLDDVPKKLSETVLPDSNPFSIKVEELSTITTKKPIMKSIFDLDYEDDDDPIHSFKLNNNIPKTDIETPPSQLITSNVNQLDNSSHGFSKNVGKHNEMSTESGFMRNEDTENENKPFIKIEQQSLSQNQPSDLPQQQLQQPLDAVPLIQYAIEEDLDCLAKQTYVTSRMSITKFHIEHLHNSCIPNVNGNWDHDLLSNTKIEDMSIGGPSDNSSDYKLPTNLYEHVVPRCNYLTMDSIPKNLKYLNLTKRARSNEAISKTSMPSAIDEISPCLLKTEQEGTDISMVDIDENIDDMNEAAGNINESGDIGCAARFVAVRSSSTIAALSAHENHESIQFANNEPHTSNDQKSLSHSLDHHENSNVLISADSEMYYMRHSDCDPMMFSAINGGRKSDEFEANIPRSHSPVQLASHSSDLDNKLTQEQKCNILDKEPKSVVQYKISNDSTDYSNMGEVSANNGNVSNSSKIVIKISRQQFPAKYDKYSKFNKGHRGGETDSNDSKRARKVYENESTDQFAALNSYPALNTCGNVSDSDSGPDTLDSGSDTLDSGPDTPDSGPRTLDSGPNTPDSTDSTDSSSGSDSPERKGDCDVNMIDDTNTAKCTFVNDMSTFFSTVIEGDKSQSNMQLSSNDEHNRVEASKKYAGSTSTNNQSNMNEDSTRSQNNCEINSADAYSMECDRSFSVSSVTSSCSTCTCSSISSNIKNHVQNCPLHNRSLNHTSSSSYHSMDRPYVAPHEHQNGQSNAFAFSLLSVVHEEENALEEDGEEKLATLKGEAKTEEQKESTSDVVAKMEIDSLPEEEMDTLEDLPSENNELLPSFNNLTNENESGVLTDGNRFKEWYEIVRVKSYNDELLTILPYVVID